MTTKTASRAVPPPFWLVGINLIQALYRAPVSLLRSGLIYGPREAWRSTYSGSWKELMVLQRMFNVGEGAAKTGVGVYSSKGYNGAIVRISRQNAAGEQQSAFFYCGERAPFTHRDLLLMMMLGIDQPLQPAAFIAGALDREFELSFTEVGTIIWGLGQSLPERLQDFLPPVRVPGRPTTTRRSE